MAVLAAAIGLAVGVVVGGLGGGGGVLTVPALVYVLGETAQDATTTSVVIVGVCAVVGVIARLRGRGVDWRTGVALGGAGLPAAAVGTLLNREVSEPVLLLALAVLTIVAAVAMLRNVPSAEPATDAEHGPSAGSPAPATTTRTRRGQLVVTTANIVLCGAVVGFLTGFLGVGGGFLVVPALVVVLRMPTALAMGTSLLVIALNSLTSLVSRGGLAHLDWRLVAPFAVAAVAGTLAGERVADRLSGATLTRGFALLLIAVGILVGIESLVAL